MARGVCLGCLLSGSCVTGLVLMSVKSNGSICRAVNVSCSGVLLASKLHWKAERN